MAGNANAIKAGAAFVELFAEKTKLYQDLQEAKEEFRQWVSDVGKTLAITGGTILGSLIPAVNAASRQAESLNAFRQVFIGANGAASQLAQTLADRVGRSVEGIATAMTPIGAMVKGMGLASDEAARFAAEATAAALDVSSFFNVASDDAFARIRSALSGSSEAVDQFGINLRQQALELKLTEMGYEGNVQAATELQKTLARLAIIQESLGNSGAAGDLERTKDQYANLVRTLQDSFQKLLATVGQSVLPIFEGLVSGLATATQAASAWLSNTPAVVQTIAGIGAASVVAGTGLLALSSKLAHFTAEVTLATVGVVKLIQYLRELGVTAKLAQAGQLVLSGGLKGLSALLSRIPFKTQILTAALTLLGVPVWGLVAAFLAVTAALVGVGAWLYAIHKRTGALQPLLDAFATVGNRIAAVWQQNVIPVFEKLGELFSGLFGMHADAMSGAIETIAGLLGSVLVGAAETAVGALAMVSDTISWIIDGVKWLLGIEDSPKTSKPASGPQAPGESPEEKQKEIDPALKTFADQVKQTIQTPQETFAALMEQLDAALDADLITAEEYARRKAMGEQDRDAAIEQEFAQTPEGKQAAAIEHFAQQLIEQTKTPQEVFAETMQKITQAFNAGAITAEVAQRGMNAARQTLQDAEAAVAEEARRIEEEKRKAELAAINDAADKRLAVAQAIGGDRGQQLELETLRDQYLSQKEGGFEEEADGTLTKYLGGIIERAAAIDKEAAQSKEQASFTTSSAREAAFGLGTQTVDEQLLAEQKQANAQAELAREALENIYAALTD